MAYLFTLDFQGKVAAGEPLNPAEEREVARAAFPSSPPREAPSREDFRAYKAAPLGDGRLLVSTAAGGGRDKFKRPVLRATGCVLGAPELTGPMRDLAAVWEALGDFDAGAGLDALAARVAESSIHTAPEAFNLFHANLERHGAFYAKVAGALHDEEVDLYLGDSSDGGATRPLDLIRPALGLLPRSRLERLHLALGGERSDYREPVLGLATAAPPGLPEEKKGLLSRLLNRQKDDPEPVSVDFEYNVVHGASGEGPRALAEAIADPTPWPDGLTGLARYKTLLKCIDASDLDGSAMTPFDLRPELAELRDAVHGLENLSRELARWR